MKCLKVCGSALSSCFYGFCHIGKTKTAGVFGIIKFKWINYVLAFFAVKELYLTAKSIGIGNGKGSFRAVDFNVGLACFICVERS